MKHLIYTLLGLSFLLGCQNASKQPTVKEAVSFKEDVTLPEPRIVKDSAELADSILYAKSDSAFLAWMIRARPKFQKWTRIKEKYVVHKAIREWDSVVIEKITYYEIPLRYVNGNEKIPIGAIVQGILNNLEDIRPDDTLKFRFVLSHMAGLPVRFKEIPEEQWDYDSIFVFNKKRLWEGFSLVHELDATHIRKKSRAYKDSLVNAMRWYSKKTK